MTMKDKKTFRVLVIANVVIFAIIGLIFFSDPSATSVIQDTAHWIAGNWMWALGAFGVVGVAAASNWGSDRKENSMDDILNPIHSYNPTKTLNVWNEND